MELLMEVIKGIMTSIDPGEKILSENLEKIVFQEPDFNKIKETLGELLLGTIEPKEFKGLIVDLRWKLINELLAFFPFYNELCKTNKDLGKLTSPNMLPEIKERDELLTEVATRLNNIYTKLKGSKEGIEHDAPTNGLDFVIDGANIACEIRDKDRKAKLSNIQLLVNKVESLGAQSCVILCDRSLRHDIDHKDEYMEYVHNNEIIETPAGTQADVFILKYAKKHNAYVVSNDRFKDHYDSFSESWIKQKRVPFTIIKDEIIFEKEI